MVVIGALIGVTVFLIFLSRSIAADSQLAWVKEDPAYASAVDERIQPAARVNLPGDEPAGGALAKMLPAFRLGIGGRLGDGRAYWSWIAMDDLVEAILHALATESLLGPVNAVSPNPITNSVLTKTLGRVLRRPAIFPVPSFALELLFGEMARETMLASFRVKPSRLLETGFLFRFPKLEPALQHLLRG